jgi:HK97 family phage major capsid protein
MPDIGSNTFPLVLGDFASGFRIYDRITLSLLRDPYSQWRHYHSPNVARRRVQNDLEPGRRNGTAKGACAPFA